ncbi:DNA-binding transcriptional MerR regulator [Arthrobacter sp. B2I5]|uniref:hypothetical protein n=1 Tax=Arthrobacter sp. B2I5 TaxID=3042266 RepID=UPI00278B90D5|nr:hypothetical protein [Arthrobacter sp. B2I5]MDQ0827214.1 DNA-binding transcriptional MerR regulator [Arthrobacter sp. B2I5]
MEDEALADIADRLYGGPLDDFIAARTAAAKDVARQDKQLAAAVRALPKPSVAAWAVNMLARFRPDVLAGLGGLGERMRAAQESLDAPALRELGRERRSMLADAVDVARSVAQEQGRSISDAIAADVEETLRAMTADERAAAAVGSSRLLKVLSADGINDVDLDGAVALPGLLPAAPAGNRAGPPPAVVKGTAAKAAKATAAKTRTTAEHTTQPKPAKPRLEAVRQTPRPASPPALERARAALVEAQATEEEASRLARDLQEQEERMRAEIAELQQETAELRSRLKAAEESLERSRKGLAATSAEAKQAVRAAGKASRTAMLAQERVLRLASS